MATTHDATELARFTNQVAPWGDSGQFKVLKFHVDMAEVADGLGAVVDGSASDVVQLWDIPVGCKILGVLVDVTTVEGAAATVAIGDGSSTAGYMAAGSINALTTTTMLGSAPTTDAYAIVGGKLYLTTDTLDLLFGTAADIDLAVFDVYVMCIFINV